MGPSTDIFDQWIHSHHTHIAKADNSEKREMDRSSLSHLVSAFFELWPHKHMKGSLRNRTVVQLRGSKYDIDKQKEGGY